MQVDFFGANCIRLKTKLTTIVFDDNLARLGAKSVTTSDDIAASTNEAILGLPSKYSISFSLPGNYEVGDVMLTGIAARSHIEEDENKMLATIFRGVAEDIKFAVIGHIHPDLSDEQLEDIGIIDLLFIPVGGSGYTLDAIAAAKIVKQLEPKVVIPTHYADKSLNFDMPQAACDEFVKVMGVEAQKIGRSLKLKRADLSDKTQIYILD
ncbi:MBL fold metallo-hydrolase [Candidatus Saccharibacteria bacterium]|nr:MBL fold metallo-hydrolase [Candidatus Saccharibacteria bacterium]MCB9821260.1 MBL fold metallo-hydrolase [Candidatus Nomurabacteria bacterium]